jgi:periplasmic divalent cation tolerance protein
MKAGGKSRVVLVTCGNMKEARRIARQVVARRLAACVNVMKSPVESYYTWNDKLATAREHLLLIKTTAQRIPELEREVRRLHSYEVPEFISLRLDSGSAAYLTWLADAANVD